MHFYSPKLYIQDPWVYGPTVGALLSLIASGVYAFVRVPTAGESYFLHSTIVFGVDLIGPRGSLFNPLLAGLVMVLVNVAITFVLYARERFLARFMLSALALSALGIAIGVYFIVGLNT